MRNSMFQRRRGSLAIVAACGLCPLLSATAPVFAQSLAVSVGVRETGSAAGIGENGGTAGTIEWINLDAQFLPFDNGWHQFTFNFGSDPVTSFAGDGVLDGTRGTLEHIRLRNIAGITDPITLYLDNIVNVVGGTPFTLTSFESSEPAAPAVGENEVMFRQPKFSGSTEPFILAGATSTVSDLSAQDGSQSLKLDWTFVNGVTTNWVRLTTFNAPKYPNPTIDWTAGNSLSFWLRAEVGVPVNFWHLPGGGNWDDPASWASGVVPNATNAVANFLEQITSDATVTLNNPITVNTIRLNSAFSYTFDGGPQNNTLTLGAPAESSQNINVEQGSHTFLAPILIDATAGTFGVANFNVARAQDVLTLAGDVTILNIVPMTVIKQGPGRMDMKKLEATGDAEFSPLNLLVNAGTLRFVPGSGTSRVNALSFAGGATPAGKLDITSNALVIDYLTTSPLATIQAQVASAYNGGAWDGNGITSSDANASNFAVGFAEASELTSIPAIFGTVDSTAVLLRLTRYGDANLDGIVNLADFNRLAGNFGSTEATWNQGDFNYDGIVNLADFNRLAGNFGLSAGPDGPTPEDWANLAAAVPEPGSLALVGVGALMALRRRR